jgi:murein DD-endopeptidase MepM/ murein hydrolase activator NlpD
MKRIRHILTTFTIIAIIGTPLFAALPKGLEIALSHNTLKQGTTLKIEVISNKPIKNGQLKMSRSRFQLFERKNSPINGKHHYVTYVGISRKWRPQRFFLWMTFTFQDGSVYRTKYKFWVRRGDFKKEYITLSPTKEKLKKDTTTLNNENHKMHQVITQSTPIKHFQQPFIIPVEGARVTSEYGQGRVYNGVPSWTHSGVDFGKAQGAPILAANDGKIVLTDQFSVHGNTIVIDHGWGIFTIYNHLDTIIVSQNATVKRGDQIGSMGSTGIATGPHLHWGMVVQNIRVNPLYWLEKPFLYK